MKAQRIVAVVLLVAGTGLSLYGVWLEKHLFSQIAPYAEHEQRLKNDLYSKLSPQNKPEVIEQQWQQMVSSGAVRAHYQSFQSLRQTRIVLWGICAGTLAGGVFLTCKRGGLLKAGRQRNGTSAL